MNEEEEKLMKFHTSEQQRETGSPRATDSLKPRCKYALTGGKLELRPHKVGRTDWVARLSEGLVRKTRQRYQCGVVAAELKVNATIAAQLQ